MNSILFLSGVIVGIMSTGWFFIYYTGDIVGIIIDELSKRIDND